MSRAADLSAKAIAERDVCMKRAVHLQACAGLLDDEGYQHAIEHAGLLDAGWRKLADALSARWMSLQKVPKVARHA